MTNSPGILLTVLLFGAFVGADSSGNRYYRERRPRPGRRGRRWVLYRGDPEGSAVPASWQAWLTHTADDPPEAGAEPRYPWQKPHRPNPTGTPEAHRPPGSLLGRAAPPRLPYEPWRPDSAQETEDVPQRP